MDSSAAWEQLCRLSGSVSRKVKDGLPDSLFQAGVAWRAAIVDWWAEQYLRTHPGGAVVELGAGYSTRTERLDLQTDCYLAVDLPGVIAVRKSLGLNGEMIAADLALPGGCDPLIEWASGRPTLLIAEGLLSFLARTQVGTLLDEAAAGFEQPTLIADAYTPWSRRLLTRHSTIRKLGTPIRWATPLAAIGRWQIEQIVTPQHDTKVWTRLPLTTRLLLRVLPPPWFIGRWSVRTGPKCGI
jgi:O-methyltransferase involved in polyketide biosynthesis